MITENISTLKIHRLTQAQYDREQQKGTLDKNAIYLTPEEPIDLTGYATEEWVESKGYLTSYTDTNTTYTLVKEGNIIKLVGSDGSETTVTDVDTDNNTTYTLTKEGNVIKLIGSDGSETTVTDVDTVITKVSQLENDAGYLTQHQSLEGYAKTSDIPTKVSAFENDKGYLTSYTDTNTTYTLTKEDNVIKLTGSDGSVMTVTDANTEDEAIPDSEIIALFA